MQDVRVTVKCCGTVYSAEAWRLVYDYIAGHKVPDAGFERQMKGFGVSRSDAFALYRAQLYEPRDICFSRPNNMKRALHISLGIKEKMPVLGARKN